jgi:hypothetical protein
VGNDTELHAAPKASILDAVVDQFGGHWIRYGSDRRSIWFSLAELQVNAKEVFGRLSGPGMTFLTPRSQNAFKAAIEAHKQYRSALVANRPGWLEGTYVFGDGSVSAPEGDSREVIVAFEPDPKFTPVGTLDAWRATVGPAVSDQPILLFALAYAFIGPLLRFAPAHLLNPLLEIVGDRETGKSTVGALSASVWAGNPSSDAGGAETWNATLNAIEEQKRRHADCHLGLDESNLVGSAEDFEKAIFKLASTGEKRRHGDSGPVDHVRTSVLSTTNLALAQVVRNRPQVLGALQSRMMTVEINGSMGVLSQVPHGFEGARAAIEWLRAAVNANYGVAGRKFVARLVPVVATRETELRAFIEQRADSYLAKTEIKDKDSARIAKTCALTFVAGSLARNAKIIPDEWGELLPAIQGVHRSSGANRRSPARVSGLDRVRRYIEANRREIIDVSKLEKPLSPEDFEVAAGFRRERRGRSEILIPSPRFQREFEDYRNLMRELRDEGAAQTECGDQSKLTIKAPNAICSTGRVYCISLDT